MDKVISLDELKKSLTEIRNLRKGFSSNFFLDPQKHSLWIEQGCLYCQRIGETFFILMMADEHTSLFFATTSDEALKKDLSNLQIPGLLVVDIVGRKDQFSDISSVFKSVGYRNICNLVRLARRTQEQAWVEDFNKVEIAVGSDSREIRDLLCFYFDVALEQIPFEDEILEMIDRKQVLVYRDKGKIAAFVIFEKTLSTLYLRYWFVKPEYREKRIGGLILRRFFYEGNNTQRQMLWVIKTNENSIKRYSHYGFSEDGLNDNIFIYGDFTPNKYTTNNLEA